MIGVVPQETVLFPGTIAENVAFGMKIVDSTAGSRVTDECSGEREDEAFTETVVTMKDVEEAARMANCEFVWGLPDGFRTESMFEFSSTLRRNSVLTSTCMKLLDLHYPVDKNSGSLSLVL